MLVTIVLPFTEILSTTRLVRPAISVSPVVPKEIVLLPILIELFASFAFAIVELAISLFVIVPAAISAAVSMGNCGQNFF